MSIVGTPTDDTSRTRSRTEIKARAHHLPPGSAPTRGRARSGGRRADAVDLRGTGACLIHQSEGCPQIWGRLGIPQPPRRGWFNLTIKSRKWRLNLPAAVIARG